MNFDFSDEQKTLQRTVREYLERECPLKQCRSVLEGAEPSYSHKVWRGAAEMGWLGAAIPERYGGTGLGHLELVVIAQELGRALAPIPFASSIYLVAEALLMFGSEAQKEKYLPQLASGALIATLAASEGSGRLHARTVQSRHVQGCVHGTKLPVPDGAQAGLFLVTVQKTDGIALALVEAGDGVSVSPLRTLDPSRPQAKVVFDGARAELLGEVRAGAQSVERLLDRAAVLFAFEQLGGAERAFAITRAYTMDRFVFGRPVASFQAIKHRLADLFVDLELTRSNVHYAAWALASGAGELATAAPAARACASEAFDLAAVEMVQMHGGVGFTWEADCHLFYRRAKHLSLVLGSPAEWRDRLMVRLAKEAAIVGGQNEVQRGF